MDDLLEEIRKLKERRGSLYANKYKHSLIIILKNM